MTRPTARSLRSLVLVTLLLGAFSVAMPPTRAACEAPTTEVDVRRVEPGASIVVTGWSWGTECNDVGICTSGACGRERCTGLEPSPPATDIVIELVPLGDTPGRPMVLVADVAAGGDDLGFVVEVGLPDDLLAGRYQLLGVSETAIGPGEPSEPFRVVRER